MRELTPFLAVAVLIVALSSAESGLRADVALVAGTSLVYATILGLASVARGRAASSWWAVLLPAALMLAIPAALTVWRGEPRYEALVLLPVLWAALHGTRRDLVVVLVAAIGTLCGAALARPEFGGLRSVLAWAPLAPLVGITVHELVRAAYARAALVQLVAEAASRALDDPSSARRTLLDAAVEIAGCDTAFLMEPDAEAQALVLGEASGVALPPLRISIGDDSPSVAVRVFRTGEAHLSLDVHRDPYVSQALVQLTGARSALVAPVRRRDEVLGVLVVMWSRRRRNSLDAARHAAVMALTVEAAAALERNELLAAAVTASRTDDLTGLANRRSWREQAEAAFAETRSTPTVALLDIDHFKEVNDRDGHGAGDEVLRELGARWAACSAPHVVVARYGGEEFAALLTNAEDGVTDVVERLRAPVASVTLSAGVATRRTGERLDDVLRRADRALYAAKAAGRDRTHVAETEPDAGSGIAAPVDASAGSAPGAERLVPARPPE